MELTGSTLANRQTFVGSVEYDSSGTVRAFDQQTGRIVSERSTARGVTSKPIHTPTGVLFATFEGTATMVDHNLTKELWSIPTDSVVTGIVKAWDDRIVLNTMRGVVYCICLETGRIEWTVTTDDLICTTPQVMGDVVSVTSISGLVFTCNRQGESRRIAELHDGVFSNPVVVEDTLYVANCFGDVVSCSRTSEPTTYSIPESVVALDSMDGHLLIATAIGTVQSIDPNTFTVVSEFDCASENPHRLSISSLGSFVYLSDGNRLYRYRFDDGLVSEIPYRSIILAQTSAGIITATDVVCCHPD